MLGKNNIKARQEKMGNKVFKYAIKRLSVGVASVAVSAGIYFNSSAAALSANEIAGDSQVEDAEVTTTESAGSSDLGNIENETEGTPAELDRMSEQGVTAPNTEENENTEPGKTELDRVENPSELEKKQEAQSSEVVESNEEVAKPTEKKELDEKLPQVDTDSSIRPKVSNTSPQSQKETRTELTGVEEGRDSEFEDFSNRVLAADDPKAVIQAELEKVYNPQDAAGIANLISLDQITSIESLRTEIAKAGLTYAESRQRAQVFAVMPRSGHPSGVSTGRNISNQVTINASNPTFGNNSASLVTPSSINFGFTAIIPADAKAGDYFEVAYSPNIAHSQVNPTDRTNNGAPIVNPDTNEVVAYISDDAENNTIRYTLTNYVENHSGVKVTQLYSHSVNPKSTNYNNNNEAFTYQIGDQIYSSSSPLQHNHYDSNRMISALYEEVIDDAIDKNTGTFTQYFIVNPESKRLYGANFVANDVTNQGSVIEIDENSEITVWKAPKGAQMPDSVVADYDSMSGFQRVNVTKVNREQDEGKNGVTSFFGFNESYPADVRITLPSTIDSPYVIRVKGKTDKTKSNDPNVNKFISQGQLWYRESPNGPEKNAKKANGIGTQSGSVGTSAEKNYKIGNLVWHDKNKDGIQNNSELGIPNVRVNLKDVDGKILETTTTDAKGHYEFTRLTPGNYVVDYEIPQATGNYTWIPTAPVQGANRATDSNPSPQSISLRNDDETIDFGLYQEAEKIYEMTVEDASFKTQFRHNNNLQPGQIQKVQEGRDERVRVLYRHVDPDTIPNFTPANFVQMRGQYWEEVSREVIQEAQDEIFEYNFETITETRTNPDGSVTIVYSTGREVHIPAAKPAEPAQPLQPKEPIVETERVTDAHPDTGEQVRGTRVTIRIFNPNTDKFEKEEVRFIPDGKDGQDGAKGEKGDKGEDGKSSQVVVEPGTNEAGDKGQWIKTYFDKNGDGQFTEDELVSREFVRDGKDGKDGLTPQASVKDNGNGTHTVTVRTPQRDPQTGEVTYTETTTTIKDGEDGKSPKAEVKDNGDGTHTITITNPDGTKSETVVRNGEKGEKGDKGENGTDGKDGLTPQVTVKDNGDGTHTVTVRTPQRDPQTGEVTYAETTTVIKDGKDGKDGLTPQATVKDNGDGTHTVTVRTPQRDPQTGEV
ncbi:signal peptide-containing protein, YSIRK family, partial [Aerococcus urinaehominis]